MKKTEIILFIMFMVGLTTIAKSQSIDDIIKTIESNNQEILAAQKLVKSKTYEYQNMILPNGPEFSYGYFPDNSTNPGPKETFEISQSFQMPCFYRNQSALSKLMVEQEQLSFQQTRKKILFEAKNLLLESIYYTKMSILLRARLTDAENLVNAYTLRLENGDVSLLELNKSKLNLLTIQNQLKLVDTEINSVHNQLIFMNGGKELNLYITEYPQISLPNFDSLITEINNNDPLMMLAKKQTESSVKMLKVAKNLQLPKFSLGYAGETIMDEKFRGFVIGLSVPIWSGRSEINKVKYQAQYVDINSQLVQSRVNEEVGRQIEKVKMLKSNLDNYRLSIDSINNLELLKKSLDLGEISSIQYFTEISYFYQVYDDYLVTEKEFQIAVNELFKYKL